MRWDAPSDAGFLYNMTRYLLHYEVSKHKGYALGITVGIPGTIHLTDGAGENDLWTFLPGRKKYSISRDFAHVNATR
jgi:hypothetical protein